MLLSDTTCQTTILETLNKEIQSELALLDESSYIGCTSIQPIISKTQTSSSDTELKPKSVKQLVATSGNLLNDKKKKAKSIQLQTNFTLPECSYDSNILNIQIDSVPKPHMKHIETEAKPKSQEFTQ